MSVVVLTDTGRTRVLYGGGVPSTESLDLAAWMVAFVLTMTGQPCDASRQVLVTHGHATLGSPYPQPPEWARAATILCTDPEAAIERARVLGWVQ
jgi:hypothetical protein